MENPRSRSRSRSFSRSRSRSREKYPKSYPKRYPAEYYRDEYYDRQYYDRPYNYGYYERDYYGRGYDGPPRPKRYDIIKGSDNDRITSTCLYVGNLPYSFREEEVRDMFGKCGQIQSVSVPLDKFTGKNKGFAFLAFEERNSAQEAMDMFSGYTVEGRKLRIDWDIGRDKKEVVKSSLGDEPRPYPRYDDRMRFDERPRYEDRPRYDERSRFDDRRPRFDDKDRFEEKRFDDRSKFDPKPRYESRFEENPRFEDKRYEDKGRFEDKGRYEDKGRFEDKRYGGEELPRRETRPTPERDYPSDPRY